MALNLMALNDNKAGMGELDKERINAIILENSKGSKFFENQQRKTQQLQKRIEEKLAQREKISAAMIKKGEAEADAVIRQIEAGRILNRNILHIDMDAFYAAVEMRDQPLLRSKPMAVGGMSMLSTSNYVARRFGVRAAMPGFIAKKLCPDLTIVPCNFPKYSEASREVRAIFAVYDSDFAPMSLDEAYLDLTEHLRVRAGLSEAERTFGNRHECSCAELSETEKAETLARDPESACRKCMAALDGSPRTFGVSFWEAARELRWRIFDATQLTASAGLAPNCLLAKVASDRQKPNGQFQIGSSEDDIALFIRALPVRKVPGIGNVSEQMLKALGITTCADIYEQRGLLFHLSTQCNFRYYLRVAMGDGDTAVSNDGERKSMSVERTFPEMKKAGELLERCRELSEALSEDLRDARMKGRTVTLKVKLATFEVRTRAQSLPHVTRDHEVIAAAAAELLRNEINAAFPDPLCLRLMGVRMSALVSDDMVSDSGQQLSLERAFEASRCRGDASSSRDAAQKEKPGFFEKKKKESREEEEAGSNQKEKDKPGFFEKKKKESREEEEALSNKKEKNKPGFLEKKKEAGSNQKEKDKPGFFEKKKEAGSNQKEKDKPGFFEKKKKESREEEEAGLTCNPKESKKAEGHETQEKRDLEAVASSGESRKENTTEMEACGSPLRKKQRVQRPSSPVFSGGGATPRPPLAPASPPSPPGESWSGFPCPVCGRMQLVQSERQFHAHLDFCLSRGAITEAIKEAEDAAPKRNSKVKPDKPAPLLKYFSKSNS